MQQSLFPIYYTAVTCCLQRPPIKSRRISDSPFYIKLQTSNLKRSLRRRRRIQLLSVRSDRLRCSYSLSTWNRSSGRRWIRYSWLRHSCRRRPRSWCCSRHRCQSASYSSNHREDKSVHKVKFSLKKNAPAEQESQIWFFTLPQAL